MITSFIRDEIQVFELMILYVKMLIFTFKLKADDLELMNEQKRRMKREEHRRSVDFMLQQKAEDR